MFYANNRDGTFSDVSGVVGLDFLEDGRSFALADFDHDGRQEVLLKNRNAPQLRLLKNVMADLPPAIAFRLTRHEEQSRRDWRGGDGGNRIGPPDAVAASGIRISFAAQQGIVFRLGRSKNTVKATIRWPSGLVQSLRDLPLNHRIWVEEGSSPSRMEPFKTPPPSRASVAPILVQEEQPLPVIAETWLLAPLAAPDFSLPDLTGQEESLSARRGKPLLLYFWSAESPACRRDLAEFEQSYARWAGEGLQLLAANVDESLQSRRAGCLASYRELSFPNFARFHGRHRHLQHSLSFPL